MRSEDGKELCSSIAKLTNLRSLIIRSVDEGENLDLDYPVSFPLLRQLGLVPEWTRSLNGLTRLVLNLSGLREDPLNSIQDLPNLALLRIYGAYIDGLRFKAQGFQKLKRLISQKLECLKSVIVEKAVLKLQIADGAASWNGAFGSSSITSIDEYGGWIVEERQNQGDNWRLSHVPEISFWRKMDDGTLVPREV